MIFSMPSPTKHLSKKRKISEITDDDISEKNGSKVRNKDDTKQEVSPYDEDIIFKVYCPADPDDPEQEDAFEAEATLAEGFHFKYRVKPKIWQNIKSYKNVKRKSLKRQSQIPILILSSSRTNIHNGRLDIRQSS